MGALMRETASAQAWNSGGRGVSMRALRVAALAVLAYEQ